jgi:hypothetical protein
MGAPPVLRERFLHLTLSMVGQKVVVTCTDGSVVEGIFHTFTPFSTTEINYVLRACHGDGVKQQGATVILDAQNVAHVSVKSMRLDTNNNNNSKNTSSGTESQFQTDVQISATRQDRNRDLVAAGSAWTSSPVVLVPPTLRPKQHFSRAILADGISLKPTNNYSMFKRRLMKICTPPNWILRKLMREKSWKQHDLPGRLKQQRVAISI